MPKSWWMPVLPVLYLKVMEVVADGWPYGRAVLLDAASEGLQDFNAVVKVLEKHLVIDERKDLDIRRGDSAQSTRIPQPARRMTLCFVCS